MNRKRLRIDNFSKGLVRDSGTDVDRLMSLRIMKNYFIDYSDGRLKARNGYTRWNSTALAGRATQLFWFGDLEQNEHLLGITNSRWYEIKSSGTHGLVNSDAATARRPIVAAGNRCFFGTDAEAYWTDDTALGGATKSYRLGIVPPQNVPLVTLAAGQGNLGTAALPPDASLAAVAGSGLILQTNPIAFAARYIPGSTQTIREIHLYIRAMHQSTGRGGFKVSAHTGASTPAVLPMSNGAVSDYYEITSYTANEDTWVTATLLEEVTLTAGTTYWIMITSDPWYKENYLAPDAVGAANGFYVSFAFTAGAASGTSLELTSGSWVDQADNYMLSFALGGLSPGHYYDYKTTFYNDTYKSESRPSPASVRTDVVIATNRATISTENSADGQVDYVGVYRRDRGIDGSLTEDEITAAGGVFEWVGNAGVGLTYTDAKDSTQLGAELDSDDHYLYDDVEAEGEAVRTAALVPAVMTHWKGRLWFAEANKNILYMSKKYEEDCSMGLTGDSVPDYFPLENRLETNESSSIIALVPLSADELAVYFRNTSVWVIRGCDDVQNPPADIVLRQAVTDVGLIAPAAVDSIRGRHVFLSRKGLYDFKGSPQQEYLSDGIQTILDGIDDSYLDDSVLITMGDSIWLAVDEDEDGALENIYILDIQRKIPAWRLYNYGRDFNDFVVRKTGTEYKTLLAADADSNYILQLESGNTDNGQAIVAELETQDLIVPNLATIYEVGIDAYYPNVPPTYEGEIRDALNEIHYFELSPVSTDDIAGHIAHPLVTSAIGARVKVTQRTVNQNHLRAIDIGYLER